MTNAELLAKINAEIERRKSLLTQRSKLTYDLILETFIKEYDDLLSFLSTLESEKPINPDDAMKELDEKIALVKQRGTWDGVDVDKYMDEVRGREPEKHVPNDLEEAADNFANQDCARFTPRKNGFIAGAKWDRSQMMKEAVEGEVIVPIYEGYADWSVEVKIPGRYEIGDKIRIIIVKEDEK